MMAAELITPRCTAASEDDRWLRYISWLRLMLAEMPAEADEADTAELRDTS